MLPGGKAVLYTSSDVIGAYNNGSLVVQSLSGGERKVVYTGGYYARYLTSGHLVFIHDGTLFAAPFDLDRLAITGQPAPAIEGVASNSQTGAAQFSAAANGTIVYLPGQDAGAGTSLRWMDQAGKATALLQSAGNWINPRFSPDGERLALEMRDEASHISVYDRGRNTLTPLASDTGTDQKPVWAPDGRWLAFAGRSGGTTANVYAQRVDGIGKPVRMTESPRLQQPSSWHPSGRFIAFEETNPHTGRDVMILPIEGDSVSGWRAGIATAFVNGPGPEFDPMFSPDGRWLAYVAVQASNGNSPDTITMILNFSDELRRLTTTP
ncbi:MAG: hypothetical protein EXQ55_00605 [Acidobacteria bacterium]|nr:hypothetical protein [Acidobacteriota bacterium]